MGYLPIAEHGIIGDLHSAALVGADGTVDWYCPERFDGPSVFAALLDHRRGGFYRIAPVDPLAVAKQLYLPETNILITRFLAPAKAATAILTALDAEDPPLRLAVGADAVDGIRAKHEMMLAELARWEHLARSTAFDD